LLGLFAGVHGLNAAGISDRYEGLKSDDCLGSVEVLATVKDTEFSRKAPRFGPDGLLYFTNVPVSKILRYDPATKSLSVFRERTNKTNGLLFDRQGRLLCCEGGRGPRDSD
jgi:sugar lactone lactonase YvrE